MWGGCRTISNLRSLFYFCSMKSLGCNCFPPRGVLGFPNQACIETGFSFSFFIPAPPRVGGERDLLNSQSCFQSLHSSPSLDIRDPTWVLSKSCFDSDCPKNLNWEFEGTIPGDQSGDSHLPRLQLPKIIYREPQGCS